MVVMMRTQSPIVPTEPVVPVVECDKVVSNNGNGRVVRRYWCAGGNGKDGGDGVGNNGNDDENAVADSAYRTSRAYCCVVS